MTTQPIDNLICFFGIGSGSNSTRNIQFNVATEGWQQFVDRFVKPGIELGIRRFHIHNPGGTETGEPMEADQFLEARNAGIEVWRDFVKAWRPITAQGIEVVAYLGLMDEDFAVRAANRLKRDDFIKRCWDSYRYPLDAGMSLGFDALHDERESDYYYTWFRFVESLGVRCYIEPWPKKTHTWFHSANTITTVQLYRSIARGASWAATPEQLTGEKVILMNAPDTNAGQTWENVDTWCPAWCREMQAKGLTPLVALQKMIERRESLRQWLSR